MSVEAINRATRIGLTVLSLTAFATVLQAVVRAVISGHVPAPAADEGTAAHIFQLAAVGSIVAGVAVVATTDWTHPWRGLRPLLFPAAALVVAFAVVFYFENIYYPTHY
jgi:ABC-type uncharacterized transport system permease subunit